MADRVQLIGGPLDGHEVNRHPGKYAWVKGKLSPMSSRPITSNLRLLPGATATIARGGTASSKPTDRAALYEDVGDVLLYAGHRRTFCRVCGTYHRRAEGGREKRPCSLGGDA